MSIDEKTFSCFGIEEKKFTEIQVAGGGIGNGNAYATIEIYENEVVYREYGNNPVRKIIGSKIVWDGDGKFTVE